MRIDSQHLEMKPWQEYTLDEKEAIIQPTLDSLKKKLLETDNMSVSIHYGFDDFSDGTCIKHVRNLTEMTFSYFDKELYKEDMDRLWDND